jgi:hypothetical protein
MPTIKQRLNALESMTREHVHPLVFLVSEDGLSETQKLEAKEAEAMGRTVIEIKLIGQDTID